MTILKKRKQVFDSRFEVLGLVGRGKGSVIYKAALIDEPGKLVAIKVFLKQDAAEDELQEIIRREVECLTLTYHPNVVKMLEFRSLKDLSYLTLPFATHGNLRNFFSVYSAQHGSGFNSNLLSSLFKQALEGLQHVHSLGIIHRDIKPENILVFDEEHICISDFGVSIMVNEPTSLHELMRGVGTLDYMAPEVLDGEVCDQQSDLYSLGLTFYEMIAGQHPFSRMSLVNQVAARRDWRIPHIGDLCPDLPPKFANLIMKCIHCDRDKRAKSASEILSSLSEVLSPKAQGSMESPQLKESLRMVERHRRFQTRTRRDTRRSFGYRIFKKLVPFYPFAPT